jgi:flagella basal body P-ring formation protein FlgA
VKVRIWFAFICTAAACHAAADTPPTIEIALRPQVAVQAHTVVLGDIATLHTTDLGTIQRLVGLPLGEAPRIGNEALVQRQALLHWIRTRTGIAPQRIVWTGGEQCQVRSATRVLPGARLEAAATRALLQWLAPRTTRFQATARPPADLPVPAGGVTVTPRPLPAQAQPTTHMVVWIDVVVDGAFVRTVPVSFEVEAYREGWVARDATAGGVELSERMLQAREIRVGEQPAALRSSSNGPITAVRALRAGEPVTEDNTRRAVAVRRGDVVALQLQSGAVQLESRAQALQEGDPGMVVRVRMSGAAEAVTARVIARGRVEAAP